MEKSYQYKYYLCLVFLCLIKFASFCIDNQQKTKFPHKKTHKQKKKNENKKYSGTKQKKMHNFDERKKITLMPSKPLRRTLMVSLTLSAGNKTPDRLWIKMNIPEEFDSLQKRCLLSMENEILLVKFIYAKKSLKIKIHFPRKKKDNKIKKNISFYLAIK